MIAADSPSRLDGSSFADLWRRHPWLLISLGSHAVLVASLVAGVSGAAVDATESRAGNS